MAENPALRAEASNPTTDPARLAAIAHEDPSLGAVIAANPAAYDGLLDWLLQYGDEAAQRAVGVRRGTIAPPAPVVTPVAPAGYSAAPKAPASPKLKKRLLFGGIGLAAVALVAVAAVVVVNVLGGGSGGAITVASIGEEPRDDAWVIEHPLLDEGDEGGSLWVETFTVGQDKALVLWTGEEEEEGDALDPLLSLINTKTGSTDWIIDWEYENDLTLLSAPGSTPYVFFTYDDDPIIVSIDPSTGDTISDSSGVDGVRSLFEPNSVGITAPTFGSDVILQSDDGVGRYRANSLDEPVWLVEVDDDERASVAGSRLIVGDTAYSLESGDEVEWNADDEMLFVDIGGQILGQSGDDGEYTIGVYTDSGDDVWTLDLENTSFPISFGADIMVLADTEEEQVTALRMSDGEEIWTVDEELTGAFPAGADPSYGVLFLPLGDDTDETTAVDLTTGEELYTLEVADDGNWRQSIAGMNQNFIYLRGNEDAELIAVETRTGDEAWTLDSPKANWYDYAVLGGNLVAFHSGSSAESFGEEPALRGLQP